MARLEVFENYLEQLKYGAVRILPNSSSRRWWALDSQAMSSSHMKVAMNGTAFTWPAAMSRRPYGLATLRSMIATWDERQRVCCEIEYLTRPQVEAEIAKPFWQA